MTKVNNISDRQQYFLITVLIFISSKASFLSESDIVLGIVFLYTGIRYFLRFRFFERKFLVLSFVYFIIFITYLFTFNNQEILPYIGLFLRLLTAYFIISLCKLSFFEKFRDIVFVGALISLPMYVLQLVIPEFFLKMNNIFITIFPSISFRHEDYTNSLIFTFVKIHGTRNCGFMWEPSGFAAMLILALMVNGILKNFKIDIKVVILILALITTFSTAGYISVIFYVLLYLRNRKSIFKYILIPIFFLLGLFISSLEFITEKINEQYENVYNFYDANFPKDEEYHLTRFSSLILDINDLRLSPIIGVGESGVSQQRINGIMFRRTNGLSNYLSKFGLLGFALLTINLLLSFGQYVKLNKKRGTYFFIFTIFAITFAAPLLLTPLFLGFQIFYYTPD